jgi:hypothetical protein
VHVESGQVVVESISYSGWYITFTMVSLFRVRSMGFGGLGIIDVQKKSFGEPKVGIMSGRANVSP